MKERRLRVTLSFEISDEDLNEIVKKGVKNLSDETITSIAKEAISAYLTQERVLDGILFENYGGYSRYDEPKRWFLDMLKNSFSDDEVKKYREMFLSTVRANRQEIVVEALGQVFADKLVNDQMKHEMIRAFSNMNR